MLAHLDRNAAAAVRHFARHGGVSHEDGPTLLTAAAAPFRGALHDTALRWDPAGSPDSVLASARAFGAEHGRDLVLWVSAHADDDLGRAARAAGFPHRSTVLGMATDRPPAAPVATNLTEVTDADGVEAFASVHRTLFGSAAPVAHFANPGALLAPNAAAVVAWRGDRPVACAMTIASGPEAGVYWVATVPDARGQGLGTLVTSAATLAGFRLGAEVVVLQATPQGAGLYRALGFTAHTRYDRYLIER